ncbi:3-keto-5-aminohexanoate cleavage protein [Kiloniella sp. b19]|uniref:3-keto-5-aminohexanoate cleavage protein n=1 Tax=Kiloniella sp. GXU_MW_B19 TaxID=3141326 RepID=UPI0031DFA7F9
MSCATHNSSSSLVPGSEQSRPMRITVAPNGARRQREHHPELPVTLDEIVNCAERCYHAGADEIHLHVRDEKGQHSLCPERYRRTIAAISDRVPAMDIQITTEAAGLYSVEEQFALLRELRPGSASIAVRETLRQPELVKPLYDFAAKAGINVQHILYNPGDLEQLRLLIEREDIPGHMRDVLLVFGSYTPPVPAQAREVAPFVDALGGEFPNWTLCAFGQNENAVAAEAIRLGGNIRIGFENNIQSPDGSPAKDNAENIALAVTTARKLARPLLQEVHPS